MTLIVITESLLAFEKQISRKKGFKKYKQSVNFYIKHNLSEKLFLLSSDIFVFTITIVFWYHLVYV